MKFVRYLIPAMALAAPLLRAAEAPKPPRYATAVRILQAKQSQPGAAMPRPATPPRPASGVPPQYRTVHPGGSTSGARPEDPAVRFVVPLVERPALVEARITIDGKPFGMLREERIDALLAGLTEATEKEQKARQTPSATSPSQAPSPEQANPKGDAPAATQENSSQAPPSVDDSMPARLRRYAASTQRTPSRDELRWLLAKWSDGPTLLVLHENFERIRAERAPVVKALDRDQDAILSAAEIAAAAEALLKYDLNQDDLLAFDEMATAQTSANAPPSASEPPPLMSLEDLGKAHVFGPFAERYAKQDGRAASEALARFDADGDGRMDDAELARLQSVRPDVRIDVTFDSRDASRSRLEVVVLDPSLGEMPAIVRPTSVTLRAAGTLLEFSAVEPADGAETDQISLGAVRDGYPLSPELDADENGKLTLRELRQAPERLAKFDRNGDGAISADELAPTLRIAVGRGATVHQQLAAVRSIHSPSAAPAVEAPGWFVRMDRNKDGDLSRREFLGGQGQFEALDADGDQLISGQEAARNEKLPSQIE